MTAELVQRNKGFNDSLNFAKDDDGRVVNVWTSPAKLEDLSPFRGFPALSGLGLESKEGEERGKVWDLSCLKGLQLTGLSLQNNRVFDLTPLRDMPLTFLRIEGNPVSDLLPLRSMKLKYLGATGTFVDDLAPL